MTTDLRSLYAHRHTTVLTPLVDPLENYIRQCLMDEPRIDRVTCRAKSIDRFVEKALKVEPNGNKKYCDPFNQIQDQLGARIVTFYLSDVSRIADIVGRYFMPIEEQHIVPDSENEFGYFGHHYILLLPKDVRVVLSNSGETAGVPEFFELQIKTLYQHAWSEANHDLAYKPERQLTSDEKRKIAFTAAQSWGADMMFNELHRGA